MLYLKREKIQNNLFVQLCEDFLRRSTYFTEEEKYWNCNFEYSSRYLCITSKQIYCTFMLPIDRSLAPSAIQTRLQVHYGENILEGEDKELVTLKLKSLAILKGSKYFFSSKFH